MPTIQAKAILAKEGQYKTIVVAYYEELDQPSAMIIGVQNDVKPFKAVEYAGQIMTNVWEYDYAGKARNRLYTEIGKAMLDHWQFISGTQNWPVEPS